MPDTMNNDEELKITAPEDSLPPCALEDLPESMQQACARAGWMRLMPVQAHALPYLMHGRDIMVQSRTGSGKTGAYLLPLLSLLDPGESLRLSFLHLPANWPVRWSTRLVFFLKAPGFLWHPCTVV